MIKWIVEQHNCAGKDVPSFYEVESLSHLKKLMSARAMDHRLGELTFVLKPDPLTGIGDTLHASFIGKNGKKKRFMRLSRERVKIKGIKWRVGEKPSGPYRTLQHRAWPSACFNDRPIAMMYPLYRRESYSPAISELTDINVHVADYRCTPWRWRKLSLAHRGVTSAKEAVKSFFELNPDWWNAIVSE